MTYRIQASGAVATVTAHALPPAAVVMLPVLLPLPNIRALIVPAAYAEMIAAQAIGDRTARTLALRLELEMWGAAFRAKQAAWEQEMVKERRQRDIDAAHARYLDEQRFDFLLEQISREIDPTL